MCHGYFDLHALRRETGERVAGLRHVGAVETGAAVADPLPQGGLVPALRSWVRALLTSRPAAGTAAAD
jgi:hypothetical protein